MDKIQMKYSLEKNADLIIGQVFTLKVTLVSDKSIPPVSTISISGVKNIIPPTRPVPLIVTNGEKSVEISFSMTVKNNIQDGDPIKFQIDTNAGNFESGIFKCTARKIAPESLILTVDNEFLDLPTGPNEPPGAGSPCPSIQGSTYCTKVHTVLTDTNGKKLSGVPVLISENRTGNLGRFHIYDAKQKAIIKVEEANGFDQMIINSDPDGNVAFYLYSQESLSAVLELTSMIQGVDYVQNATSPVYAISSKTQSSTLRWPNIEDFWSGDLTSDGSPTFNVMITKYDDASHGDVIIFYVNGNRTEYIKRVGNVEKDLGSYSIQLPYSMFKINKEYSLSYVVILSDSGSIKSSFSTRFVYMGGAIPQPDKNIKRNYDPCVIHTSLGVIKDNIVPENTYINYDSIRSYSYNHNTLKTGLFIAIIVSDTNKGGLPSDAKVTKLTVYINAPRGGADGTGKFQKDYTPVGGILTDPISNTKYIGVHVPCSDLVKFAPDEETGAPGNISFDYEVLVDGKKEYGKIWQGVIDTRASDNNFCTDN
ncbi:hypothetical protein KKJ17_18200 [Xenorhabdus bovienii]|uniref:hypothetical protein n=1 Tax=Xenorhabdus bovienii TaxID=40576 RepID=UPI0023B222C3|nr:hypothetical protein [Xenorhabdus bovienii]MDE9519600.1 hypothetical protein [Xenorhabdus bovienii]